VPQVEYRIKTKVKNFVITSPQEFPENNSQILEIQEPVAKLEIITPEKYIGDIMQIVMRRRGEYVNTEYISNLKSKSQNLANLKASQNVVPNRVILYFKLPLAELLTDFYDKLKSVSAGFASLNYETVGWQSVDLVKLAFLISGKEEESLAMLAPKNQAYRRARKVLEILKQEIPAHLFEIRLQAKIGGPPASLRKGASGHGKIIASERIPALKKNVTAKLYGGDVTRKMKLLKKQKKGKKKMAAFGQVNIPNKTYLAVLRR